MPWIIGVSGDVDPGAKTAIDAAATSGYIGAANNDGVLRTNSPLTYTDGGDFITLDLDETVALTQIGYTYPSQNAQTPSAAFTVDWAAKEVQRVTITGVNLDVTFSDPGGPARLVLVVVQGDGDDTIDWSHEASILWPGSVAPTLSTTTGYVDVITFYFDGTNYFGVASYDFR